MRHSKKLLALLLAAALALGMLAGCGEEPAAGSAAPASEEPAAVESEARRARSRPGKATRLLTDMAGRELELPAVIGKAFSTDPTAAIFLYTLARTGCWAGTTELNDLEKSVILDEYETLPEFRHGRRHQL